MNNGRAGLIRHWGVGETPADAESIPRSVSSWLQVVISPSSAFFPPSFLHPLSLLTQSFLSGFRSKTKPSLIFHHDEWFLNLVSVIRSDQQSDTDVGVSPSACPRLPGHGNGEQKDAASLLALASTSRDTKAVLNFPRTFLWQDLVL